MNYKLYGFLIGKDIHLDIENKCLYRLSLQNKDNNFIFSSVCFNETMMQLFLYLLQNGQNRIIPIDELHKKIWEENNLSPSSQRLWLVFKNLNKKIHQLGVPEDFIKHIKRDGYSIRGEVVTPLYYQIPDKINIAERSS